jgi:ribosomal protein S18 acetylase RimI-like enzyme
MSGSELRVRRVRLGDAEALYEVRLRSLATDPTAFLTTRDQEAARGLDVWKERAERAAHGGIAATFLAWDGDAAVGLVVANPSVEAGTTELLGMWVAPEARRDGVGRELVEAALAWAAESGYAHAVLDVARGNEGAPEFYEALGFEFTGEESEPLGERGVVVRSMRRRLNP